MTLKKFLQAFGIIAVILSLFPFVAADYWWIRMFDYPHVQLTILTLVALLVYFFRFDLHNWRDYTFVIVLAVCFLLQLTKIYPYTPFAKNEVRYHTAADPQHGLSILATNVLQKNEEYDRVVGEIFKYDPDLLIFTETNTKWQNELRKRLKNYDYNYRMEMPLDNTYGMLVYSRLKLLDAEIKFLLEDSIPSMHTKLVMPSGELVELHIIHPTPPMPPHDASSTDRDAQMMIVAKMAKESKLPVIVAGDFNDVAWSETTQLFKDVSGLLDPRIGRGFYNTYNANSWLMRWPLDHLFVSDEFRLVTMEVGGDVESDHFPLYAKLSLEPGVRAVQTTKPASEKVLKEAEKQIEKEDKKDQKEKAEGKE
ncbi:endonuclease/exonuclease/phosphatase family protein [Salinimicrobium sp. CAU 1759]